MKSGLKKLFNATSPVPMSGTGINRYSGLTTTTPGAESLMRAYGEMGTVFSIVSLYAQGTARPEWHLYRKQPQDARRRYSTTDTGSDQRVEVVQHQALSLLNAPNPFYTRFSLFETDQMYLDLTGECYWVLARNGTSFPTGIWPVRPDRMEPVPSANSYLAGWIYTAPDGRTRIPLSVDEVIQVKYPNPLDPYHGLGPVQSVLVDIDASKYSASWNRNFFINSARPDGVIAFPAGSGSMNDEQFNQWQDRWRESHRGVSRAHKVAILEGGATWTPQTMTAKDMDFANLRDTNRDVVREAFRMHKVMLGVSDDVNRANAQTGEEVFSSWGIVPRLDRKKDMLNNIFLPMFGSTGEGVEFDYVTPVPANREQDAAELVSKTTAAATLVNAGFDPHDALEVVGLPDMDVVEKATQAPALPPAWVPAPPAAPGADAPAAPAAAPPTGDEVTNRLKHVLSNGHVPVNAGDRS